MSLRRSQQQAMEQMGIASYSFDVALPAQAPPIASPDSLDRQAIDTVALRCELLDLLRSVGGDNLVTSVRHAISSHSLARISKPEWQQADANPVEFASAISALSARDFELDPMVLNCSWMQPRNSRTLFLDLPYLYLVENTRLPPQPPLPQSLQSSPDIGLSQVILPLLLANRQVIQYHGYSRLEIYSKTDLPDFLLDLLRHAKTIYRHQVFRAFMPVLALYGEKLYFMVLDHECLRYSVVYNWRTKGLPATSAILQALTSAPCQTLGFLPFFTYHRSTPQLLISSLLPLGSKHADVDVTNLLSRHSRTTTGKCTAVMTDASKTIVTKLRWVNVDSTVDEIQILQMLDIQTRDTSTPSLHPSILLYHRFPRMTCQSRTISPQRHLQLIVTKTAEPLVHLDQLSSPKTFWYAITNLVKAIKHFHHLGVINRDISLGNVMATTTGEIVIVDWDLACFVDPKSETREASLWGSVGTPAFMAKDVCSAHSRQTKEFRHQVHHDLESCFYVILHVLSTKMLRRQISLTREANISYLYNGFGWDLNDCEMFAIYRNFLYFGSSVLPEMASKLHPSVAPASLLQISKLFAPLVWNHETLETTSKLEAFWSDYLRILEQATADSWSEWA